ncbi:hypothetical protein F5Y05DRAFT_419584 [Hypoxylon sp. FL0543]|nr:hypothetical protein F5Y05DRAFT_419584 [Hypoxylon sp. FL0543]
MRSVIRAEVDRTGVASVEYAKTGARGVPTTTRLDAKAFAAGPKYTDSAGRVRDDNNEASLDHEYENSWVKNLFEELIDPVNGSGKLLCVDLNQFFFPKAPALGTCHKKNRVFVTVSRFLNRDGKGKFFADAKDRLLSSTFVGNPQLTIKNDPTREWYPNCLLRILADYDHPFRDRLPGCVPQITSPPNYLTDWDTIKMGFATVKDFPDAKTIELTAKSLGLLYPELQKFSNFAKAVEA